MPALIITLITTLLPLAVKLITYIIDKNNNSDELRKQFLELLQTLQSHEDTPTKIKDKCQAQIDRIKAILEKENQAKLQ